MASAGGPGVGGGHRDAEDSAGCLSARVAEERLRLERWASGHDGAAGSLLRDRPAEARSTRVAGAARASSGCRGATTDDGADGACLPSQGGAAVEIAYRLEWLPRINMCSRGTQS